MSRKILFKSAIFFFFGVLNFISCTKKVVLQVPKEDTLIANIILDHNCFVINYNEECKQANSVAYTLKKSHLEGEAKRKDNFKQDPLLPKEKSATLEDYKNSGYDRGHLAPAADFKWSQECTDKSFYLSNISPQMMQHNRGVWKRLEEQVRNYAIKYDSVLVVTGPILLKDKLLPNIGFSEVCVPELYYKALLINKNGVLQSMAFVVPNEASGLSLDNFVITVDSLEKLSKMDFFYQFPVKEQENFESVVDYNLW
jgi:endonuclease G, mitochondrial